jgi:hypothetical protein
LAWAPANAEDAIMDVATVMERKVRRNIVVSSKNVICRCGIEKETQRIEERIILKLLRAGIALRARRAKPAPLRFANDKTVNKRVH